MKFSMLAFANEKLEQVVLLIALNFLKCQKKDITVKSLALKNEVVKVYITTARSGQSGKSPRSPTTSCRRSAAKGLGVLPQRMHNNKLPPPLLCHQLRNDHLA